MTYQFIGSILRRIEHEYMDITEYNTNKKVNQSLGITEANIYIEQRVEDYPINQIIIHTYRKINYQLILQLLSKLFCTDICKKILDDYIGNYQQIKLVIDIEYDPFIYPFKHAPIWKICQIELIGLNDEIHHGILYLIYSHNKITEYDWSPAITLRTDLLYFMIKFCKFLKYI